MKNISTVRSSLTASEVKSLDIGDERLDGNPEFLGKAGISLDSQDVIKSGCELMVQAMGDAAPALFTTASAVTPVQFLRYFSPQVVRIVTAARNGDKLLGRDTMGTFADAEVVIPRVELSGVAKPFTDTANGPLSNFNMNYLERKIVRFEANLVVGPLESEQTSRARIDALGLKRNAASEALAIMRNNIAFNGFSTTNYGILNDPELPAYVTVANGASGDSTWDTKTATEIYNDIVSLLVRLHKQSGANIDPTTDKITIGIATNKIGYLNKASDYKWASVEAGIKLQYKNVEFVSVPQFDGADSGEDVLYIIAENLAGYKPVMQSVQDLFRSFGVRPTYKGGVKEAFACATAGTIVANGIAVVRASGI